MFLHQVANQELRGDYGESIRQLRDSGAHVPEIRYLFAYKPHTQFLMQFTHRVMRGPSPLSAGLRELIAAFTSRRNDCLF